jgi:hypothetical protein
MFSIPLRDDASLRIEPKRDYSIMRNGADVREHGRSVPSQLSLTAAKLGRCPKVTRNCSNLACLFGDVVPEYTVSSATASSGCTMSSNAQLEPDFRALFESSPGLY